MAEDLGLSTERTELAWQRTALALVVAAAVMARLTFGRLGWVAVIVLAAAMLTGLWVFAQSGCTRAASSTPSHPTGKGTPALLLVAITSTLAAVELAAIAVTHR